MKRTVVIAGLMLAAGPAHAEIAVLTNGTSIKIVDHRAEGESVVLVLDGGGELGVPASLVRGFVPDEVVEEVTAPDPDQEAKDLKTLVAEAARRHGLDPGLVLAVVEVESAFKPEAVSPKGAQGLMQLMPGTAVALGVKDVFDPESNIEGGTRHLKELLALYGGDLRLALAAYNAGSKTVERYRGIPPYRETRQYVQKVLERYRSKI